MKKIALMVIFSAVSLFAGDPETQMRQLVELMDQQQSKVLPKAIDFDAIAVLNGIIGATAQINENDGLFSWYLLPNYYYDYEDMSSGTATSLNLDYHPTTEQFAIIQAFFGLRYSKPSTLENYKEIIITASKNTAGTSYQELLNEAGTVYGFPGCTYVYSAISGTTKFVWFNHILAVGDVAFDIYFLATEAAYQNSLSSTYCAIILALASFSGQSAMPASETFEQLRTPLLLQNYPNPFNNATVIPFSLSKPAHMRLDILNEHGQLIRNLLNETRPAGNHEINLDASDLSNGVYFYRLIEGDQVKTNKMLLIK